MKERRLKARQRNISVNDVLIGRLLYPEAGKQKRPQIRGECPTIRPCPFVGCRYNNYLEVTDTGNIREPENEPWDVPPQSSCSLEAADKGPQTTEEIASNLGVTRQRIEQIYYQAIEKIKEIDEDFEMLLSSFEAPSDGKVHLPFFQPMQIRRKP